MKDYEEKYPISIIPDTYYIVRHSFSFFSNKEKIEHDFYVRSKSVGIGSFDSRKKTLLYMPLTQLLNNRQLSYSATSLRNHLNRPNVKLFFDLINECHIIQCLDSLYSYSFESVEGEEKYLDNVGYVRQVSIISDIASTSFQTSNPWITGGKMYINGNFFKELDFTDTNAILAFIKISYWSKFQNWTYNSDFRFDSKLQCIDTALRRGWIKERD